MAARRPPRSAARGRRAVDQYDAMVLEKALADVNRRDPRWHNTFPSSELIPLRRQWPVLPTFVYGGINYGRIAP